MRAPGARRAAALWFIRSATLVAGFAALERAECARIDPSCDQVRVADLPPVGEALEVHSTSSGWLEIDELGQQLVVSHPSSGMVVELPMPLRHGLRLLRSDAGAPVVIRRLEPDSARGSVRIATYCEQSPFPAGELRWMERATLLARRIETPTIASELSRTLTEAVELAATAPNPLLRAFGLHLSAQAMAVNGRHADSIQAFERAEAAWNVAGQPRRALAARVGRAEAEFRVGHFGEALAIADANRIAITVETAYFVTRLRNTRCLALAALGRTPAALKCHASTVAAYARQDERSEYALALQTYAGALYDAGRISEASRMVRDGLATVTGPDAPLNRGRLLLLAARIALQRGDIARSLTDTRAAIDEFETAKVVRWKANALLRLVDLYRRLGAVTEARAMLAQAVPLLSWRDSRVRLFQAIRSAAELEREAGHPLVARALATVSVDGYAALEMPVELDETRLLCAELDLDRGAFDAVDRAIAAASPTPMTASHWSLLSIDLDMRRNRLGEAQDRLSRLRSAPLGFTDWVRFMLLDARRRSGIGDVTSARRMLTAALRRIETLARASKNPLLARAIRRQAHPLRTAAIDIAFAADEGSLAPSLAMWMPGLDTADARLARIGHGEELSAFEAAVARELLTREDVERSRASSDAQRMLLPLLTERYADDAQLVAPGSIGLVSIQRSLGPDEALVTWFEGSRNARLLWLTRDTARTFETADPLAVHSSIVALTALLHSPETPLHEIDAASRRLSEQLLARVDLPAPPARLYVLQDSPLSDVEWPLLSWPKTETQLLDTTTVSYVHLQSNGAAVRGAPGQAYVFTAAMDASEAGMPVLASVAEEVEGLSAILRDSGRALAQGRGSGAGLRAALAQPGAWVHVAAHGTSQPARIGYSGIWFESGARDGKPEFVSWLDILGRPVRADLVVLNTCELGKGLAGGDGNPSFASALSIAGAGEVVADDWAMSDASAAQWAAAFYAAMTVTPPPDAALALRMTQRSLRARRAFRHPYYWAGLRVIERKPVRSPEHKHSNEVNHEYEGIALAH